MILLLYCLPGYAQASGANVEPLPTLDVYPDARATWIAQRAAMNGLPISIRAFSTNDVPSDVIAFYRRLWRGQGVARAGEAAFGGFRSVGVEMDGYFYTVQVRSAGKGAEGVLVVSATPERVIADKTSSFPVVAGDRIMEKIEAIDLGVRAETLIVASSRSVETSIAEYRRNLLQNGWQLVASPGEDLTRNRSLLTFQKGPQQCQVTVVAGGGHGGETKIFIHWIKSGNETG